MDESSERENKRVPDSVLIVINRSSIEGTVFKHRMTGAGGQRWGRQLEMDLSGDQV